MSRPQRLSGTARKAAVVLLLVGVFLTLGLPRWLARDAAPLRSDADANFARVCREHGGTPRPSTTGQRMCTVRYGGRVYVMDAITPEGFDEDTARFQRQGCEEARRQEWASNPGARRRQAFVYHPDTGVCERRP